MHQPTRRLAVRFWPALLLLLGLLLAGCNGLPGFGQQSSSTGPIVSIDSPPNNTNVPTGREVVFVSTARDSELVERIDLYVNNELIRSDGPAIAGGQYIFTTAQSWVPTQPGPVQVKVIAYNVQGQPSRPAGIAITVQGEGMVVTTPSAATPQVTAGPTMTLTTATPTIPISQGTPVNVGAPPPNATTVQVFTPTARPTSTPVAGIAGQVAVRVLNIRSGPGTTFPVVGSLPLNAPVTGTARDASNGWVRISYSGGSGWVFANYLTWSSAIGALPVGQ